jgi:hypothetical protein
MVQKKGEYLNATPILHNIVGVIFIVGVTITLLPQSSEESEIEDSSFWQRTMEHFRYRYKGSYHQGVHSTLVVAFDQQPSQFLLLTTRFPLA